MREIKNIDVSKSNKKVDIIATDTAGIQHFIKYNPETGEFYFGTDKNIIKYRPDAKGNFRVNVIDKGSVKGGGVYLDFFRDLKDGDIGFKTESDVFEYAPKKGQLFFETPALLLESSSDGKGNFRTKVEDKTTKGWRRKRMKYGEPRGKLGKTTEKVLEKIAKEGPIGAVDLSTKVGISRNTVDYHLKKLSEYLEKEGLPTSPKYKLRSGITLEGILETLQQKSEGEGKVKISRRPRGRAKEDILEIIKEKGPIGFTDIGKKAGMKNPFKYIKSLIDEGKIEQGEDRLYKAKPEPPGT